MLIMIDNYDSFTYNLVQYLMELGADLKIYRNDELTADDILAQNPEGIILSPGPGRPDKAGVMPELIIANEGRIPMFGVCLGHQAIAEAYGGIIDYAPKLMHGKTSNILHYSNSKIFKDIPNPFVATRYHSLIVDKGSLPDCFEVTAITSDNLIMALEHKEYPLYGVQFHPESIMSPEGKQLLKNFLEIISA